MKINIKADYLYPAVIYRCNLPGDLNSVKEWVYQLKETDPKGSTVSNLLGWQSKILENNECENLDFLFEFLSSISNQIFKGKCEVTALWANISPKYASNRIHCHSDYVGPRSKNKWSGVYYIQVPKNGGDICFSNPYCLDEFEAHTPIENELVIFPAQVYHSVEANLSTEDRISIAFNFEIKT